MATRRQSEDVTATNGRPQRLQSVKRMFSIRRSNAVKAKQDEAALPYGHAHAKSVQLYVTSDDLNGVMTRAPKDSPSITAHSVASSQRTSTMSRSTASNSSQPETMPRSKWSTWPASIRVSRAGSYRFDDVPTLTRTPWEWERGQPNSRWSRVADRKQNVPVRMFAQLPREIYQCILDHVENLHCRGMATDVLGLRRDLRSLCLVDKRWHRLARERLYRDLWLPGNVKPVRKRFSKQQGRSPLWRLAATLRDSAELAALVHRLHVCADLAEQLDAEGCTPFQKGSTLDALQDVVRQCCNLELISGYVVSAMASTFPLIEALSLCPQMKAFAWTLNSEHELPSLASFIYFHDEWTSLQTLVITADVGVDLSEIGISMVLQELPSLKHLMLSGLYRSDFNDATLLALPSLESLRLEQLRGLTDEGLEKWAFLQLAPSLERLSLIGLELVALHTVQAILSHQTRLRSFTFVQEVSPEPWASLNFADKPITLGSRSLEYLHWDCLVAGSAVAIFADGIASGKFSQLDKVKVPCDYEGRIQALCQPISRATLTREDMDFLEYHNQHKYERNFRVAQIQAQLRLRESWRRISSNLDDRDVFAKSQERHLHDAPMGDVYSRTEYSLEPGVSGQGFVHFDDVARPKRMGNSRMEQLICLDPLF